MRALVAVDWGTSSLRAARIAGDGTVLEQRASERGILTVPAGGFPGSIEARNYLTTRVDYLALRIDLQTRQCVMKYRRRPRRVEGWFLNLKHRRGFSKLHILTHVDERVVFRDGLFQRVTRHGVTLVRVLDLAR